MPVNLSFPVYNMEIMKTVPVRSHWLLLLGFGAGDGVQDPRRVKHVPCSSATSQYPPPPSILLRSCIWRLLNT